jgi:hypothetical protein
MEAIEWRCACLPPDELLARLKAAIPIHEMSARKLLRLLVKLGRL